MNHPSNCDCSRCQLPIKFYRPLGLSVNFIDPEEKDRRAFEARQKQEERVLLRIRSTGQSILYLEPSDSLKKEDKEVADVLDDILTRFHGGSEYFSTLEIQIIAQELAHTIDRKQTPANALLRLLMGSVVNFSDRPNVQRDVKILLKENGEDNNNHASELMNHLSPAYDKWAEKAKSTNDLWLVRFAKDRTSTLFDPSPDHRPDLGPSTGDKIPAGLSKLPDSKIREIMVRNETEEKKKHPEVFNTKSGVSKGRVKPPYWPVAFATDDEGHRYLSDKVLGAILPDWDKILRGDSTRSLTGYKANWTNLGSEIEKWRVNEKAKLEKLGSEEWPAPYGGRKPDMGNPGRPSQVWYKVKPAREASASDVASNTGSNEDLSEEASSSELDGSYEDRSKLSSPVQSPAPSSNPFASLKARSSDAGEGSSRQFGKSDLLSSREMADSIQDLRKRIEILEGVQKLLLKELEDLKGLLKDLLLKDPKDLKGERGSGRSISPTASRASSRWAPSNEPNFF